MFFILIAFMSSRVWWILLRMISTPSMKWKRTVIILRLFTVTLLIAKAAWFGATSHLYVCFLSKLHLRMPNALLLFLFINHLFLFLRWHIYLWRFFHLLIRLSVLWHFLKEGFFCIIVFITVVIGVVTFLCGSRLSTYQIYLNLLSLIKYDTYAYLTEFKLYLI
jgi:hypothetical protein